MRLSLVFSHAMPTEALDGMPALARIASYGRREAVDDADAAVARLLGAADPLATAPLAALGAGLDTGAAYVLRADPVTFVAGRDDVLLAGRVDDLAAEDAAWLVDTLNRHFAGDGLVLHAPRADAWFATARERIPVEADPPQANAPIGPRMPRGPHAAVWRRWLSEMQMLLHEHPVNAKREASGLAPATGIWISSGGTLPAGTPKPSMSIHASPSRAGDVAIGIAWLAQVPFRPPPARFEALERTGDALVVVPHPVDADALGREWLSPAIAALERGDLDHLSIIATNGRAQRYESSRPSWWRRLRGRA